MIPVMPPSTKVTRKPMINRNGVLKTGRPVKIVVIQAIVWIPAGIPMIMPAAAKKVIEICGRPTVNMWWTHRPKLRKPVATRAMTTRV